MRRQGGFDAGGLDQISLVSDEIRQAAGGRQTQLNRRRAAQFQIDQDRAMRSGQRRGQVNRQRAGADAATRARNRNHLGAARCLGKLRTLQHGLNAGHQVLWVNGLGNVIDRARAEALQLALGLGLRG